jgi:hypothetical protein
MNQEKKYVSMNPRDMSQGGGLWDNIDAILTSATFFNWDKAAGAVYAKVVVKDDDGVEYEQNISCGKGDFGPSNDGSRLELTKDNATLNSGSNFGIFLTSMINAGFPEDKVTDDITVFVGGKYHFDRIAAPKRSIEGRKESKYEDKVLVVTKVLALPGEKKAAKGAAKGPQKSVPKAKPGDDDGGNEIATLAKETVMSVLLEAGEPLGKAALAKAVGAQLDGHPLKSKVVVMVFQEAFLGGDTVDWTYEGGMVSLG